MQTMMTSGSSFAVLMKLQNASLHASVVQVGIQDCQRTESKRDEGLQYDSIFTGTMERIAAQRNARNAASMLSAAQAVGKSLTSAHDDCEPKSLRGSNSDRQIHDAHRRVTSETIGLDSDAKAAHSADRAHSSVGAHLDLGRCSTDGGYCCKGTRYAAAAAAAAASLTINATPISHDFS